MEVTSWHLFLWRCLHIHDPQEAVSDLQWLVISHWESSSQHRILLPFRKPQEPCMKHSPGINGSCTKGHIKERKLLKIKKPPTTNPQQQQKRFRQLIFLKLFWLFLVKLCLHTDDLGYKNKIVLLLHLPMLPLLVISSRYWHPYGCGEDWGRVLHFRSAYCCEFPLKHFPEEQSRLLLKAKPFHC